MTARRQKKALRSPKRAKPIQNISLDSAKQGHRKPSTKAATQTIEPSPRAKRASRKPQKQSKPKPPRTDAQYSAKPEKFKETWERVISTVAKMRTEKASLTQASREMGINPRTVRRWGASALRKRPNGTYAAKPSDNLLRLVLIPTPDGPREIAVRGSKQVRLLAEYWNALHRYLQTGDAKKLKSFEGKQITDANGVAIPLSVHLPALNRLGSAGVLSFESIYARSA